LILKIIAESIGNVAEVVAAIRNLNVQISRPQRRRRRRRITFELKM
jgi:hypothetical protein